ncbi:MAG: metallophosphoesterase [Pseudomonadota bacterium]
MIFKIAALFALIGVATTLIAFLWNKRAGAAVGFINLAAVSWIAWFEPRAMTIERLSLEVDGLSEPVRILAIGDPQPAMFHWSPDRLHRFFERGARENPDIILWLGDYAYEASPYMRVGLGEHAFVDPADTIAAMASIDAPMGSFAILGNHDWWWDGPEVIRLLNETHISVLIDTIAEAEHPSSGARLTIIGLDDVSAPRETRAEELIAEAVGDAPTLVLSHSPDTFPRIPEGVALTLSGHTHCGQVFIPFVGRPMVPTKHKGYACGLYKEDGRRLFVTSGIGTAILPIRFLTPPELAVIDLVPARADAGR